jgi:hypothetical protein
VEIGAPAPAEHAVVPFDKVGEGTPGVGREWPDGEVVRRAIGRHMDNLEHIADDFRPVIRRRLATIGATSASAADRVLRNVTVGGEASRAVVPTRARPSRI